MVGPVPVGAGGRVRYERRIEVIVKMQKRRARGGVRFGGGGVRSGGGGLVNEELKLL